MAVNRGKLLSTVFAYRIRFFFYFTRVTNERAGALATNSCVCLAPEEITYRRLSPGVVGRQGHSSIVSAPCLRSRCKQKSSVFIIGWCNSVALSIRASQTPRAAYRAAKCVQKSKGFLVLSFISRRRPMTSSHGDGSGTCGSLSSEPLTSILTSFLATMA